MVTGEGTGHLLESSEWWVGCGCGDISRSASISRAISHSLSVSMCGFQIKIVSPSPVLV